jgi:hypothetical protein
MQNDLWSAYYVVYRLKDYEQRGEKVLAERRLVLLELLGRLIVKIAPTPDEVRSLEGGELAARRVQKRQRAGHILTIVGHSLTGS